MTKLAVGAVVGAISGMRGGLVDSILMRIVDMAYAFPSFLLAVILATALGQSVALIVFALGITGWAGYARLVRGQVLALKNQEYTHAARTLGTSACSQSQAPDLRRTGQRSRRLDPGSDPPVTP